MKSRQRGACLMPRALSLVDIFLRMLIIPVWIKRGNDHKVAAVAKGEPARNAGTTTQRAAPAGLAFAPSAAAGPATEAAPALSNAQMAATETGTASASPRLIGGGCATQAVAPTPISCFMLTTSPAIA